MSLSPTKKESIISTNSRDSNADNMLSTQNTNFLKKKYTRMPASLILRVPNDLSPSIHAFGSPLSTLETEEEANSRKYAKEEQQTQLEKLKKQWREKEEKIKNTFKKKEVHPTLKKYERFSVMQMRATQAFLSVDGMA